MERHNKQFNENNLKLKINRFESKRASAIEKRNSKIKYIFKSIQEVEPSYIDMVMYLYHKKGSTLFEKIEIANELSLFYSDKIIKFFYKLNDAENNYQIRNIAFLYLQKCGLYVGNPPEKK